MAHPCRVGRKPAPVGETLPKQPTPPRWALWLLRLQETRQVAYLSLKLLDATQRLSWELVQ